MIDIQEHFVPEKVSEVRKRKILRLDQTTVTSAIRRQPAATSDMQSSAAPPCPPSLPACRDLSTWVSNRDLCQWISKFRFFSFFYFESVDGWSATISQEIKGIHCFLNQQKNWRWWIHFPWSLTTEALKGALVTLSRPLAAGLRISFSPRVILGFLHQDFSPWLVSTAISPWIHQFSSDHWS